MTTSRFAGNAVAFPIDRGWQAGGIDGVDAGRGALLNVIF